jgi:hypothetical protein
MSAIRFISFEPVATINRWAIVSRPCADLSMSLFRYSTNRVLYFHTHLSQLCTQKFPIILVLFIFPRSTVSAMAKLGFGNVKTNQPECGHYCAGVLFSAVGAGELRRRPRHAQWLGPGQARRSVAVVDSTFDVRGADLCLASDAGCQAATSGSPKHRHRLDRGFLNEPRTHACARRVRTCRGAIDRLVLARIFCFHCGRSERDCSSSAKAASTLRIDLPY